MLVAVALLLLSCQSKAGAYCRAADLLRAHWPSYRSTSCTKDGAYCVLATDPADPDISCGSYRVASIYSPIGADLCAAPTIGKEGGEWTLSVTAWAQRGPDGLSAGRLLLADDGTDIEVYSGKAESQAASYWPKLEPLMRHSLSTSCPLLKDAN
jgi:hypothetical protein